MKRSRFTDSQIMAVSKQAETVRRCRTCVVNTASARQRFASGAPGVVQHVVAISLACTAFGISETCYRYQSKRWVENEEIANWLVRLTDNNRNWGFGLCYLYLRDVKGFGWNHKRNYRIYRELGLSLQI